MADPAVGAADLEGARLEGAPAETGAQRGDAEDIEGTDRQRTPGEEGHHQKKCGMHEDARRALHRPEHERGALPAYHHDREHDAGRDGIHRTIVGALDGACQPGAERATDHAAVLDEEEAREGGIPEEQVAFGPSEPREHERSADTEEEHRAAAEHDGEGDHDAVGDLP